MDWNLVACARSHLTYAPDEEHLREHLQVRTTSGDAWRCLRCGDFVVGPPRHTGPADEAPVPLRGQLLRDAVVLRLLAVDRLLRGLLVLFAAYGVWRFRSHRDAVRRAFDADFPLVQPLANKLGWRLDDSAIVHSIRSVLEAQTRTLLWIAIGLAVYGVLQFAEGTGLWLLRRWGEYLAAVATSLFIPLEVYEIVERLTWVRVVALAINVTAVIYLVYRKRLFGAHGGRAAHDAERHQQSLMQVAVAAGETGTATTTDAPTS